jgi:hypothetical protein
MIWYVYPIKEKISWEGHLSGFIVGLILAIIYKNSGPQKPIHIFKETEFDLQFDEEGNFAPKKELDTEDLTNN